MLEKMLNLIGIHRSAMISGIVSNVVKAIDTEFKEDKDGKNIALDSLIALLESCKES